MRYLLFLFLIFNLYADDVEDSVEEMKKDIKELKYQLKTLQTNLKNLKVTNQNYNYKVYIKATPSNYKQRYIVRFDNDMVDDYIDDY